MDVKLFKREGTYFSEKDNKDKPFTNFYIQCNDHLIPVEIKYFPNPKTDNRDPGYQGRFAVLSAFAEKLPERESKGENVENSSSTSVPTNNAATSGDEAKTAF